MEKNNPLQLLKKNAPAVYARYKASKLKDLNDKLAVLRTKYTQTESEHERLELKTKADIIKKRVEEFT